MTAFSGILICTTILFGIIAQMLLLDTNIKNLEGRKRIFFVISNFLVLGGNMVLSLVLPTSQHMKLYVLVIHVPIFFIFWISTKTSAVKVIFALLTAVFMIYPANMVLTIISHPLRWLYPVGLYFIYIGVCVTLLWIIKRFFKIYFYDLNRYCSNFSFIKLCLLPLTYNIGNYWLGMYGFPNANSAEIFLQRNLIFVVTLISYILIFDIAKSVREKEALEGAKLALTMLLESGNKQLAALQATQAQAAVYRHDMRHHLSLIGGYLADGNSKKAEEYVRLAQEDIETITPNLYCGNNTVNLILSSFAAKAKKYGIVFSVDAQLPHSLSISDTELCALLSNALENATGAAKEVMDEKFRNVRVSCHIHKRNLLILVENSFTGKVTMENGLPQSHCEGHGLGVKSIRMIAEKHGGFCSFEARDEIFTLRIVLPQES